LGQGKEKARTFLIENRQVTQEIQQKVMEAGGFGLEVASSDEEKEKEKEFE
jgi:recombination protein RecA